MKYLRNNRGYALFLTVLILVIFAVLSVSLTTMIFSGADRSETREHVTQAGELSEKGIEHLTAQINKDLQNMLGENGIARSSFEGKLLEILNKYRCSVDILKSSSTLTGNYEVCIEAIENIEGNELRKLVTFKSLGTTEKQNKELRAKVEFGAGSVPEVLKYAVGTNIKSTNPRNGEGNLLLHGGVDIYGDVKVDGNLVTYNKGTGAYRWIDSIQPRMHGVLEGVKPRLVVGGNMYKLTRDPYRNAGNESTHAAYLNNTNFTGNRYEQFVSPEALFDTKFAPQLVNRNPETTKIGILDKKEDFYFRENDTGITRVNIGLNEQFNNYNANTRQRIVPYREKCNYWGSNCSNDYNITTSFYNTNTFNYLSLLGRGHIRSGNHSFKNGLYVDKDLTIGTNNQNSREDVSIDGPIYVNGKLTIQGANLRSNAIIYVNGDVEIRFSSIQGKNLGAGETGTMIVFATGDIFIANVSENQDNPTTMKGYFYSEKNIEMYGVGSNVHIDGGVAGNRVVLNALRGRVRNSHFSGHGGNISGVGYVETIANQRNSDSRLTIKYDTELIENFLKLNPPEPVIYDVDSPELISRE